jgi:hypothetical protein
MPEGLALVGRVLGAGAALGALKTAWLAHLAFLAGGWLVLARRRAGDERWALAASALLLGEGLLLVGQVTMVLANNQDAAGVAFVVPGAGLLAAGWIRLARSPGVADQALPRSAAAVGATLVLLLALAEPLHWWSDLTHRSTNDMDFDPARAELVSAERSPALAGLWYQPPTHKGYPLEDLLAAAELMAEREGDFLLIGDAALLYGLAGKRSTLPSLWFHPGVTIPLAGTPEFVAWQQRLVDEVEAGTIDRVLEERAGTWIRGWTLADLPRVQAAVVARGYEEQGLGAFRVLELSPR